MNPGMKKDAQKIMGTPDPSYHPLLERISHTKNSDFPPLPETWPRPMVLQSSKGHQQSKILYILKNWHLEFSEAHFRVWRDDLL